MTLCVSVTTADGLVMGADSMTVMHDGRMTKTYAHANKVFEVPDLPIAVMTYGLGALGRRSIASLIDEWNDNREAFEKGTYTVEQVARSLGDWVFGRHRQHLVFLEQQAQESQQRALDAVSEAPSALEFDPLDWITGLVVGGYQPSSMYPWLWTWEEPARPGIAEGLGQARPHEGDAGEYGPAPGLDYWGDTRAVERLVHGLDRNLFTELLRLGVALDAPEALEALLRHGWDVLYEGMPVQDAADLAKFVLEIGIGFERFRQGTPQIGGELDIAIVTRSGLHWHERKPLTSALAPRNLGQRRGERPKL